MAVANGVQARTSCQAHHVTPPGRRAEKVQSWTNRGRRPHRLERRRPGRGDCTPHEGPMAPPRSLRRANARRRASSKHAGRRVRRTPAGEGASYQRHLDAATRFHSARRCSNPTTEFLSVRAMSGRPARAVDSKQDGVLRRFVMDRSFRVRIFVPLPRSRCWRRRVVQTLPMSSVSRCRDAAGCDQRRRARVTAA